MARARKKKGASRKVQIASFVIHALALGAIAAISTGNVPAPIAVMMAEIAPPSRLPEPAPVAPVPVAAPEAPAPRRAAPRTPPPAASAEPASSDAPNDAPPDYGIAFEGLASGGPGGIAVPMGDPGGVRRDGPTRTESRALAPAAVDPERGGNHGCRDEDEPPRQRRLPRVVYSSDAIAARIEGRVRISVVLDADGRVTDASVVTPLGHGLDEAALASVRNGTFEPAKRCGRPIATTFVLGVSFRL